MRKCEEINEHMRKDPKMIYDTIIKSFSEILIGKNQEEINDALVKFNRQLLEYVKQFTTPLSIINQELNSLLIIASNELIKKLNEQKDLITDFNNEMQNCLNSINIKDGNSFQKLRTIGQENRWKRFTSLNNEIISLMRKEIGAK